MKIGLTHCNQLQRLFRCDLFTKNKPSILLKAIMIKFDLSIGFLLNHFTWYALKIMTLLYVTYKTGHHNNHIFRNINTLHVLQENSRRLIYRSCYMNYFLQIFWYFSIFLDIVIWVLKYIWLCVIRMFRNRCTYRMNRIHNLNHQYYMTFLIQYGKKWKLQIWFRDKNYYGKWK